MGDIKTTIHADKSGMIEYLAEKRAYWQGAYEDKNRTQKQRAYASGMAEGLWLAIAAIQDWAEADNIVIADEWAERQAQVKSRNDLHESSHGGTVES